MLTFLSHSIILGVGATIVMDLAALLLRRLFGWVPLNYAFVGRWIGHMARIRFRHSSIGEAQEVQNENAIGWSAHYVIGICFAAALLLAAPNWLVHPNPLPALTTGLVAVIFPFFIMQPAFGVGFAASKTPNPWSARLRSTVAHLSFGLGLYMAGLAVSAGMAST